MTTVIFGLLVFGVLVIFHEYGHFLMARWMGIRVERFSIGFGPVVLSRVSRGVQYAISAFPLGGYVKMAGDDPRKRDDLEPGDFFAAAWWRRILVAFAGPGANLVLAVLLSIVLTWVGVRLPDAPNRVGSVEAASPAADLGFRPGDRITAVDGRPTASLQAIYEAVLEPAEGAEASPTVRIEVRRDGGTESISFDRDKAGSVFEGLSFPIPAVVGEVFGATAAYKAGLTAGDRIVSIDGTPVKSWADMTEIIRASPGKELAITVERDGRQITLPVTPAEDRSGPEPIGKIGIGPRTALTYTVRFGFTDGIVQGTRAAFSTVGLTVKGIASLFASPSNLSQISGPVAIIQASGDAAKAGMDRLLNIGVVLSIALMVFNLLPIPILDGGMVVLSLLEAIRKKPMGEKGLTIYQGIGLAVIGTIFIFVLINDPLRIIQRQSALGRATDVAP